MADLLTLLRAIGLPDPETEYAFALPERKYRFDFAWPSRMVALEIDGGQWKPGGGRHNKDSDRIKLNEAAARHWVVLRFSYAMLRDEAACLDVIRRALGIPAMESITP